MKKKTLTRTVKLPLEVNNRKMDALSQTVDASQEILKYLYEASASMKYHQRKQKNSTSMYRMAKNEFPEHNNIYSGNITELVRKVGGAWKSWYSNGGSHWDNRPQYRDENTNYFSVRGNYVTVSKDNNKYGIQLPIIGKNKEWFGINSSDYHEQYLSRIVSDTDSLSSGSCEVHITDNMAYAHLTFSEDILVREPDDVQTFVGIDLNHDPLYAGAVWHTGNGVVEDFFPSVKGTEFKHHRERISARLDRAKENGLQSAVEELGGHRLRYTDQILDTLSREIVDKASEHSPSVIAMEDLTGLRENIDSRINHEWPYAMFKEKLEYKAKAAGIAVVDVDSKYTSQNCHKCGKRDKATRRYNGDKRSFYCKRCDYGPGADSDFNAAVNIAKRGFEDSM